uniref:7TM_GPCR_Srx domain-containing protein n=1 Tax=Panagrellus redivivus TaxID=6233 RepID=A0A7E4UMG6_PANRE
MDADLLIQSLFSTIPWVVNSICNHFLPFHNDEYLYCVTNIAVSLGFIAPAVYLFVVNEHNNRNVDYGYRAYQLANRLSNLSCGSRRYCVLGLKRMMWMHNLHTVVLQTSFTLFRNLRQSLARGPVITNWYISQFASGHS